MDLLRRIRWGNVTRAAALLAAVALVLAWPRLRSDPPSLPPEPALAAPAATREEGREFGVEPIPEKEPRARAEQRGGAESRRQSRGMAKSRRAREPRRRG